MKVFVGILAEQQEFLAPFSELCLADCIIMFQSCYPNRLASNMQIRLVSIKKMSNSALDCTSESGEQASASCRTQTPNALARLMRKSTLRIHLPPRTHGGQERIYNEVINYLDEREAFCFNEEVELNGVGARAARKLAKCMSLLSFFDTQLYPRTSTNEVKIPLVFKRFMNMNQECDGKYSTESFPPSGDMEMVCLDKDDINSSDPTACIAETSTKKKPRTLTLEVYEKLAKLGSAFLREAEMLLDRDANKQGDWKTVGKEVAALVLILEHRWTRLKKKESKDKEMLTDEPEIHTCKWGNWFAVPPKLSSTCRPCMASLNTKLLENNVWDVIYLEEYLEKAKKHVPYTETAPWFKNRCVREIKAGALSCSVILFQQKIGGGIASINTIIKIPQDYFEDAASYTDKTLAVLARIAARKRHREDSLESS